MTRSWSAPAAAWFPPPARWPCAPRSTPSCSRPTNSCPLSRNSTWQPWTRCSPCAGDALTAACGTALITAVHRQAPGVRLRLSAEPGTGDAELRRGEVDLESSSSAPTLPDIRHRLVGSDRLVVAVRPGHPLTEGPLSIERYAAAEHLTVSRRGSLHDPIDDALTTRGLERHVVAAGPTAAFALQLALDTDLVVTLPNAVTRAAREQLGLATLPPPLPLPEVPQYLL